MENINLQTTQNVAIHYRAAGLGPRIVSILLDTIFRYAYFFVGFMVFYALFLKSLYANTYPAEERNNELYIGLFILYLLPFFLYHLLCETFLNGQSFGKKIVKIKVVKLNGTQPGFGSYLLRSVFRIIDDSIIGIVVIAATKNSQRLGDMVAGTTVIEMNPKMTIADTILSEQKPDYQIVYGQVSLLSDKDANIIKEVLQFSEAQGQADHLKLLADKIKAKYGIHGVQQNNKEFLTTLLADYSQYQFEN